MLAVLNILAGLTILAWPLLVFASGFFFDAPGSEEIKVLWALAYACLYYPAAPILGNLLFWSNRLEASVSTLWLFTAVSYSGIAVLAILFGILYLVIG